MQPWDCTGVPQRAIKSESTFIRAAVSEFSRFVLLSNVVPNVPVLWFTRFCTWLDPIFKPLVLPFRAEPCSS